MQMMNRDIATDRQTLALGRAHQIQAGAGRHPAKMDAAAATAYQFDNSVDGDRFGNEIVHP